MRKVDMYQTREVYTEHYLRVPQPARKCSLTNSKRPLRKRQYACTWTGFSLSLKRESLKMHSFFIKGSLLKQVEKMLQPKSTTSSGPINNKRHIFASSAENMSLVACFSFYDAAKVGVFSRITNDFYKFFQISQLSKPHDILIFIFIRKKIFN